MAVINFIVNDIFRQPPLFLGLIAWQGFCCKEHLSVTL